MADESTRNLKQWQVPAYGTDKKTIQTFCINQVRDGRDYASAEPGAAQLEESIRILTGRPDEKLAAKQRDGRYSSLSTNRLKRNIREMVNALSDIQWTPGFHSDSNDTQGQAELLNRVGYSWFVDRFIDLKIKKGVQWMAICPRGWLEICYRQLPGERGKSEIDLIPRSAFEVVMTGVPESGDHQEAYTVTIIKDMPVYLAHATWPDDTTKLVPDRETPNGWVEKAKTVFDSVFSGTPEKATAKNPTVRLYYQYVLDLSVNRTGSPVKIGYDKDGKETPWSYIVPPVGGMIKSGYDSNGTPVYKAATHDQARLFPNRRLIVFTEKDTIYDGPAFDWHGKVPLVKLSADSWPFGDFSMVHDVSSIHNTVQEIERVTHQTVRNRFNPSMLFNMRALTRDKAKTFRTDLGGQRIGYNGQETADPMKPALPQSFYSIEGWIYDFQKRLEDEMDYQMGVRDVTAMAQMKVGASSDTMEKLAELAGPIVKGISRDMERSMRDLWEMFKYLVYQYYTTPRIMQIVGPDGVTPTNFDFDPGNLIPSHLPGENMAFPSVFERKDRAMWAADHIPYMIVPNTLHAIQQTSRKLTMLQMWRGGFPVDPWTMAEVMNIPNFGKKPEGSNDILGRYMIWKGMESDFAIAEQLKQQNAAAVAPEPAQLQRAENGGASPSNGLGSIPTGMGPNGGFTGHSGRAPTAQAAPRLAEKGDGRPYVRESN